MYKIGLETFNSFVLLHAGHIIDNVQTEMTTLFATPQAQDMGQLPCGEVCGHEFALSQLWQMLVGKGRSDASGVAVPIVDHTGIVWDIRGMAEMKEFYTELVCLPGRTNVTRLWGNPYDARMIIHTLCTLTNDPQAIVNHIVKWHGARPESMRIRKVSDVAAAVVARGDTASLDILKFGACKNGTFES